MGVSNFDGTHVHGANEYARKSFEPELSSASLAPANVTLADPLAAKGKTTFEAQSCNACQGDAGVGTAAAPPLVGIKAKFSPEQLAELFKQPTAKMNAGGMPPIDLPPDDLKALIAYVEPPDRRVAAITAAITF
jgi:cytochrome c553